MSPREKLVSQTAGYLKGLARRRSNGIVTADDVQNYLSRHRFSSSVNERLSVVRSVLSERAGFTRVGATQSTRDAARGRMISTWSI